MADGIDAELIGAVVDDLAAMAADLVHAVTQSEAEKLMEEMAIGIGDDLTLWYMGIPGGGQQYVAGQLVGTVGSWVGVKRDGSSQITWRNMRLLENIMPGLPPKQKIGVCTKCKGQFPKQNDFEVICPKCSSGTAAAGSA